MKKILAAALALFCLLIPFGCNDPIQNPPEPDNPPEPEKPTTYQNSLIDRKDGLHILAVGNSFTYVSTTYLWETMNDLGFTNVKVARLYIGRHNNPSARRKLL